MNQICTKLPMNTGKLTVAQPVPPRVHSRLAHYIMKILRRSITSTQKMVFFFLIGVKPKAIQSQNKYTFTGFWSTSINLDNCIHGDDVTNDQIYHLPILFEFIIPSVLFLLLFWYRTICNFPMNTIGRE